MPLVAVDVFMRTGQRTKVVCTRCKHRYAKSYARSYYPSRINLLRLVRSCTLQLNTHKGSIQPFSDGWSWMSSQRGLF